MLKINGTPKSNPQNVLSTPLRKYSVNVCIGSESVSIQPWVFPLRIKVSSLQELLLSSIPIPLRSLSLYVCLFLSLFVSMYLSLYLSPYLSLYLSLSVYHTLSVSLSLCLCLFLCLSLIRTEPALTAPCHGIPLSTGLRSPVETSRQPIWLDAAFVNKNRTLACTEWIRRWLAIEYRMSTVPHGCWRGTIESPPYGENT